MTSSSSGRTLLASMPSPREVRTERVFEASRERVWEALTQPALLTQWWGRGNPVVVERFEPFRGGHWRFVEHSPQGVHGFEGRFREVLAPERIVQTFEWDGEPGQVVVVTTTLESLGPQRTKLVALSLFHGEAERDGMIAAGMTDGQEQSYRALDGLLDGEAERRQDEHELRSLLDAWAQAVRDGDLARVAAYHPEDVVLFDVAAPLQHRGLSALRDAWAPFLDRGPHRLFELGELRLHVDGRVAFAHALLRIEAGKDFSVRLTLGFEKEQGSWKIAHEHHSAPL